MRGFRFQASLGGIRRGNLYCHEGVCSFTREDFVERTFIEFDKTLSPYWRQGAWRSYDSSGAYHYLPEMKDRKAIERLFDIELEYTFSTSEVLRSFGLFRDSRYSKIL